MDLRNVTVRWEETHEFKSTVPVDYDEVHKWLTEDGASDQEITPAIIKDWLLSGPDGYEPEREDMDRDFVDNYGLTITEVNLP